MSRSKVGNLVAAVAVSTLLCGCASYERYNDAVQIQIDCIGMTAGRHVTTIKTSRSTQKLRFELWCD